VDARDKSGDGVLRNIAREARNKSGNAKDAKATQWNAMASPRLGCLCVLCVPFATFALKRFSFSFTYRLTVSVVN
jgi:hypothetical protein